jgi:hypothetical protein
MTWIVRLLRCDARCVRTFQLALFAALLLLPVTIAIQILSGAALPVVLFCAIGSPVVVVLWHLYFCKSVRLRTYLGSDDYLRKAFLIRKRKAPEPQPSATGSFETREE